MQKERNKTKLAVFFTNWMVFSYNDLELILKFISNLISKVTQCIPNISCDM